MLEELGLSGDQEAAYMALLLTASLTLTELAEHSGIGSRRRAARVAAELVEQGLATRTPGTPARYTAVAPDIGLDALVRHRLEGARRVRDLLPGLMERYWAAHVDPAAAEVFELVGGNPTSRNQRFVQLQRGARREIRAFDCPPYEFPDTVCEPDPVELAALAEGVTYRILYQRDSIEANRQWPAIEAAVAAGEQARVVARLPLKLTLFDDAAAALPVTTASGKRIAVLVRRSSLFDALSSLFETYWDQAIPLTGPTVGDPLRGVPATPPPPNPSAADDRLVAMLAAGMSDEAIRRALGVSASTVQRRLRALMRGLGAATRFQAGLQVGRLLGRSDR